MQEEVYMPTSAISTTNHPDWSLGWPPEPDAPPRAIPDAVLHGAIDHMLVIQDQLMDLTGALCALGDDFCAIKHLLERGIL